MNSRNKALLIGGLVGSALGVLAAWVYIRTTKAEKATPRAISIGNVVRLGLAIMEVLRQVATLGEQEKKGKRRGLFRKGRAF